MRHYLLAPLLGLLTLFGLVSPGLVLASTGQPVQIAYQPQLETSRIQAHLVGQVIRHHLHLPVKYVALRHDVMWKLLAHDRLDISVSAWLQTRPTPDYHQWWTKITDLGSNVTHTRIGLVVPAHASVRAIDDLRGKADRFHHRILVVPNGSGAAASARQAIKQYHLNGYRIQKVSAKELQHRLDRAHRQHRDIVAAAWGPSPIEQQSNLRWLQDRQGVFETNGQITTIVSNGLLQRHPQVYHLMHRYYLGRPALAKMMKAVAQGHSVEQAVRDWRQANADTVRGWLKHE